MKLSRLQQVALAFFVSSLLPAYLIANWRYETQLANLNGMLQKEQALHVSADKLLGNCENNSAHKAEPYDATHQICSQGADIHARTEHAMTLLNEDKAKNEIKWYQNFGLAILLLNLLAFALYRAFIHFKYEAD
jgi:pyrroline-5-carboxylate reductase